MSQHVSIALYAPLLNYKKWYTPQFVEETINKMNLNGMRIFAHLKDETLVSSVFCHSECDEINIGIYSLTGQLLLSKDYQLKSGNNVLSLNLENLTTGTYLIRFKSNGTMRNTGKFILLK